MKYDNLLASVSEQNTSTELAKTLIANIPALAALLATLQKPKKAQHGERLGGQAAAQIYPAI